MGTVTRILLQLTHVEASPDVFDNLALRDTQSSILRVRHSHHQDIGAIDWLFSDVVCYPKRLLALVEKFLAADSVRNFLCTIKFQGETDFATQARFAAIPGSRLMHLHANKHELTWVKLNPQAS